MGHTITPTLDQDVLERLYAYALPFRPLFPRSDQFRQGRIYLHGLLLDGERKSIEPLSHRVPDGDEQRLQQFVNQSPWDAEPILQAYRAEMAEAFATPEGLLVLDDTGFPKQGKHSVGVARQYSGTRGKTDNCQIAVSWHYATATAEYPWHSACICPSRGRQIPSVWIERTSPKGSAAFGPSGKSPWTCSIRCWTSSCPMP